MARSTDMDSAPVLIVPVRQLSYLDGQVRLFRICKPTVWILSIKICKNAATTDSNGSVDENQPVITN